MDILEAPGGEGEAEREGNLTGNWEAVHFSGKGTFTLRTPLGRSVWSMSSGPLGHCPQVLLLRMRGALVAEGLENPVRARP